MKRFQGMLLALACLFNTAWAQGVDQPFENQASVSWRERVAQSFPVLLRDDEFDKSIALVIGISRFQHFDNLANPRDPLLMKDYLLHEAGFDYVHLLTEEKVSAARVRELIFELRQKMTANSRFVFYWVGHGVTLNTQGRQLGYLPVSRSERRGYASMMDMRDLKNWDDLIPAKQVLYLLDACFSGGAGVISQSEQRAQTLQQIKRRSRQLLTAGLANEKTFVLKEEGRSVFTRAVLDGLRGKADASMAGHPKDGVVSVQELAQFVKKEVARVKNNPDLRWPYSLTPTLSVLPRYHDSGDFFFFSDETVQAAARRGESTVIRGEVAQAQSPAERKPFEPEMVRIPAGSFEMGCKAGRDDVEGGCDDDEKPVRTVNVPAFELAKTEVTFEQYDACTAANICLRADDAGWGRGKRPVINLSWDDAQTYIRWLNQQTGKNYRLPSESEWEYAARAGTDTAYSWGNTIGRNQANCPNISCGDNFEYTAPVGSFAANPWGLNDMHGNVWEWVQDCYQDSYDGAPNNSGAVKSSNCERRVLRGGSWYNELRNLRSAFRLRNFSSQWSYLVGFRLARTL